MSDRVTIHCGDALKWAAEYDGPPFHALLADPPYHLTDPRDMRRASPSKDQRDRIETQSGGFMNCRWDGGGVSFQPETWAALAKHLYPGAFVMAFAGTRGYHRMACAMEDGGLIIHPLLIYCFGSGFPKATRIGKQRVAQEGTRHSTSEFDSAASSDRQQLVPADEIAELFSGHRYGLQGPAVFEEITAEGEAVEAQGELPL